MASVSGDDLHGGCSVEISTNTQLPTAPSSLAVLVRVMSDPDIEISTISEAVAKFPVIAARLVSLANSAWSSPVEPITRIDKACLHLGFGLVRSLSLSIAVAAPFTTSNCAAFDAASFWCDTFMLADAAHGVGEIAGGGNPVNSETARSAALFASLSLLWLADAMPVDAAQVLEQVPPGCVFPDDLAQRHCGMDTGQVGGRLGRAWGLPTALVAAMEHHADVEYAGQGREYADIVRISAGMVSAIRIDAEPVLCRETLERLRIDDAALGRLTERMSSNQDVMREIARSLHF